MAERMIPVICVAQVPAAAVLSDVLKIAYAYANTLDCSLSLVLLPEPSALAAPNFGAEATQSPVAQIATYPSFPIALPLLSRIVASSRERSKLSFLSPFIGCRCADT